MTPRLLCYSELVFLFLQGYARLNQAEAALDVMREFWQAGGEPDDSMFEVLVTLCVRTGEFRKALQVVNAMDKLGRRPDKMRIKKVLEEFYRCSLACYCIHLLLRLTCLFPGQLCLFRMPVQSERND